VGMQQQQSVAGSDMAMHASSRGQSSRSSSSSQSTQAAATQPAANARAGSGWGSFHWSRRSARCGGGGGHRPTAAVVPGADCGGARLLPGCWGALHPAVLRHRPRRAGVPGQCAVRLPLHPPAAGVVYVL
jgi:hypothetical protein